jgi:hypothetical protein
METINGCTVIASSENPLTHFGPVEMRGAYVAEIGAFPPGEPGPPVHFHPHTDEAFYVADGDATFRLGDREVRSPREVSCSCHGGAPTPSGTPATDRCELGRARTDVSGPAPPSFGLGLVVTRTGSEPD